MCTLIINFHANEEYPILIAANRDELYARPSSPPSIIETNPTIFAPQDLEAGGTWFGINEYGLIAMITNAWVQVNGVQSQGEHATRSRGQLTLDVLRCSSIMEAKNRVKYQMEKDHYRFFNLAVLSFKEGVIFSHTETLNEYPLARNGATILNVPFDPNAQITDTLPVLQSDPTRSDISVHVWLSSLRKYLSRHPDYCKHNQQYGTRSSQILMLSKRIAGSGVPLFPDFFWYANGPPCRTSFENYSDQLKALFHSISAQPNSPV